MASISQELREAVLQAAIQGKLTEQLPEDGDISQVLNACEADKANSIEQGRFRNEPFRGKIIDDTIIPFDIPETWAWMFISDMSLFQEGPGILAVDFRKSGVPLIRIAGMQSKVVSLVGCNYLDPNMVQKRWNHFRLDLGDIVISTSASMDKIAEVTEESEGAIPYTGLIRFKMYGGIDKEFFKLFLQSPFYMHQVDEQKAGGMIKHYGPSHLKKMMIPIPPVPEQHRIVARVEELMAKIDELEKIENELKALHQAFPGDMKAALLQAAMQGKLTSNSDYIEYRYGDLFDISGGSQPSKSYFIDYPKDGYIQLYQTRDYGPKPVPVYIPKEKATKRTKTGDILLARYGGSLGKVFLAQEGAYNVAMAKVVFLNPSIHDNKYVYYYHLASEYQNFCRRMSDSRSAQAGFNKEDIYDLTYNLFSLAEQHRIVERLDKLLPLCDSLQTEL